MTRRTPQRTIVNRVLSVLLSAMLAVTLMPAAAFAAVGEAASDLANATNLTQSATSASGAEGSACIAAEDEAPQRGDQSGDAEPSDGAESETPENAALVSEGSNDQTDAAGPNDNDGANDAPTRTDALDAILDVEPANLEGDYAPGEVIIVYEDDMVGESDLIESDITLNDIGIASQEVIVEDADLPTTNAKSSTKQATDSAGDIALAKLDAGTTVEEAVARLEQIEGVAYVQPNYVYRLADYEATPLDEYIDLDAVSDIDTAAERAAEAVKLSSEGSGAPKTSTSAVPSPSSEFTTASFATSSTLTNDPRISDQYYLSSTRALDAWQYAKASNKVTVAVVDSGCNLDHADLKDNLLVDLAWDCISNQKLSDAKTSIGNGGDSLGHGTMVSGVIAAKANNSAGIAGVSYDANVLPLRVFESSNTTNTGHIIDALGKIEEYINNGSVSNLKVINLSLGGYTDDASLHSWIQKLRNTYGLTIVCSGGNGDDNYKPITAPCYPSDYDECISVTSLTKSGAHSAWCDYNASKDISAPGEEILTTSNTGEYVTTQGTSLSAPIVSGMVAMLLAAQPSALPQDIYSALREGAGSISGTANPSNGSAGAADAIGALDALGVDVSDTQDPPVQYDPLGLTISYDRNIKCKTNTKFTLNATGGSGKYKYMLSAMWLMEEDYQYVNDPSRGPGYVESNVLEFEFTASGYYRGYFYVIDVGSGTWSSLRKIIDITVSDPNYPSVGKVADNVAAECVQAGNTTEYDKALWLHDWMLDHCTYDSSLVYCNMEGVLTRGKGTCESYHRAYVALLKRVGIQTGRIEGNGHVWTAVRINGQWMQVDATWNDGGNSSDEVIRHMYFGLDDATMALVHSDHSPNSGYESNTLANSYLVRQGLISQWTSAYRSTVQSNINQGKTSFSTPINKSQSHFNNYHHLNVITNVVAYDLGSVLWYTGGYPVRIKASIDKPAYYSNGVGIVAGNFVVSATYLGDTSPESPESLTAKVNTTETSVTVTAKGGRFARATSLSLPTWSENNGQDDIRWYSAKRLASGAWTLSFPISNHKDVGTYFVHAYGVTSGINSWLASISFEVTAPSATFDAVSPDGSAGLVDIGFAVSAGTSKIRQVDVPVWFAEGGQDDIVWHKAELGGDGRWSVRASIAEHRFQSGRFLAHVYVRLENGAYCFAGSTEDSLDVPAPVLSASLNDAETEAAVTVSGGYLPFADPWSVTVPVWSEAGGQDDLVWYPATPSGGAWTAKVPISRHASTGKYFAHVYAKVGGRLLFIGSTSFEVTAPSATFDAVSPDGSAGLVDIGFAVSAGTSKIRQVDVPVWFAEGGQDDIVWHKAELGGDGRWSVRASIAEHRFQSGRFLAHVYVRLENGAYCFAGSTEDSLDVPAPVLSASLNDAETEAAVTVSGGYLPFADPWSVTVPVWSEAGGQDDLVWYPATPSGGAWTAKVPISRHASTGKYFAHVYAKVGGRLLFIGSTSFEVTRL